MADALSAQERAAIEAAIAAGKVQRVDDGVRGDRLPFAEYHVAGGIMSGQARRLKTAKRRIGLDPDEEQRAEIEALAEDDYA